MAEGWGGKRNGAGAKPGNQHAVKHGSLVVHAPRMLELAQKWLYGKSAKNQQWAFDKLLPYVFRKQPQEVESTGELTVTHTHAREQLADKIARIASSVEEAGSPERN